MPSPLSSEDGGVEKNKEVNKYLFLDHTICVVGQISGIKKHRVSLTSGSQDGSVHDNPFSLPEGTAFYTVTVNTLRVVLEDELADLC